MTPQQRTVDALPWVDQCIRRFARRLPDHVDRQAIAGAAHEALVKCSRRYDPDNANGATFKTFAWPRVCGAMLDECRTLDPNTRDARTAGETAETVSGDAPVGGDRYARSLFDTLTLNGDFADRVCDHLDLVAAIRRLPLSRRTLLFARMAGWKQHELGTLLGVTEARVCQIEKVARRAVQSSLAA